ncbi:MAG TPA: His/Gly/Thr/Pro-type tRNA ligase C-terminal domain-containing protein, partial [Candidatus Dormibacteraeota bacterium]|nr:His/Gly/Thr/Pro-type tRNA ligase C-terminal domain-containing protein [Candidatus Dormibacteraeota bacterium]
LIQQLRTAGVAVDYSLTPAKGDKQFKRAQELNAGKTVRLERNPAGEISARIRSLKTREEKSVSPEEAIAAVSGN